MPPTLNRRARPIFEFLLTKSSEGVTRRTEIDHSSDVPADELATFNPYYPNEL